jgi:hypothetical protein
MGVGDVVEGEGVDGEVEYGVGDGVVAVGGGVVVVGEGEGVTSGSGTGVSVLVEFNVMSASSGYPKLSQPPRKS